MQHIHSTRGAFHKDSKKGDPPEDAGCVGILIGVRGGTEHS